MSFTPISCTDTRGQRHAWLYPSPQGLLCSRCDRFLSWATMQAEQLDSILKARLRHNPDGTAFESAVCEALKEWHRLETERIGA